MVRRVWLSLGLVLLGGAMLATAQLASATFGFRQGGIFRVGFSGASVQVDPQLAYVSTAWWLEYATAAKLVNYQDLAGQPGTRLRLEVAARYTVSRDGRTWTFFIRKGFRFSDGLPVTAASFRYAIDRVANHDLGSPGSQFITDANGANIVGAREVAAGRSQHVRGVVAKGNRLTIHLTRRDPAFLSTLAMPFFQATSVRLPLNREVTGAYPSAGPYFVSRNDPNVLTQLRRNPYYRGVRTHNVLGLEVWWNLGEEAAYRQVRSGALDEGPLPAAHVREVAKVYGVNRTRFWKKPMPCLSFLSINDNRPLFRNNVELRRALSWVVNRKAYAAAAGAYLMTPWSHLLPPTSAGSVTSPNQQPFRGAPNPRKARALAAGHLRRGRINIGYRSSGTTGALQARLLRADLVRLGVDPARIRLRAFSGSDIYDAMARRGTDLDLGVGMGWCANTSPVDPASLVRQALESSSPFGIGSANYTRRLRAALRLTGNAQYRALGKLDVDLMKNLVPTVVVAVYNNRYFFSSRVDPRSLVYQNVYADWSIPRLALK